MAVLLIAGLAGSPFAATAKMSKHHTSHHHMSTSTTTGTNMKSSGTKSMKGGDATGQGTVGPGGNANGSNTKK
jgi:hypothetical protein